MANDGPAGFDITLMQRIAAMLGREWQLVRYEGADFNGIFARLDDASYECIASGTTITPRRRKIADFCAPYAISGQSLVVDVSRHPNASPTSKSSACSKAIPASQPPINSSPSIAPRACRD
jgi:ABC-type amino acid transport substrate-binding protein